MDYTLGTQSVDWSLINIWCCGKFISSVDLPTHTRLCHAVAESSPEEKRCETTGHRRRSRNTSMFKPHTRGSCLPGVLLHESAQLHQKLGKLTKMSAEEGEIFTPVKRAKYWSKKKRESEMVDTEAIDETYDSSKLHCSKTVAVLTSSSVDNFSCDQCDYKANWKKQIKVHKDSVHDGITYSCDQCDHQAKEKNKLKRHKDSVHEGLTFSCDQCDYKANWKGNLKMHKELVHENIIHSCDQCDYQAKQKRLVKIHKESVHDGVRYPCDQCDYQAKQKNKLKRHEESIHEGVTYSCDQCDYKAKWKHSLKIHKEYVHEDITYSCDQCDYQAKQKTSVKRHKEYKHSAIIH